jgi:hypothetical protein
MKMDAKSSRVMQKSHSINLYIFSQTGSDGIPIFVVSSNSFGYIIAFTARPGLGYYDVID